ncbi:uncharacterized protein [Apostichopus japonicus]
MKLFIHPTTKRGPSVILLDINEDLQSCPENTEEDVREELEAGEEKEQEDEAADFFTVEKVLKKRQKKGKTEYLVTWQESRRKPQIAAVNPCTPQFVVRLVLPGNNFFTVVLLSHA